MAAARRAPGPAAVASTATAHVNVSCNTYIEHRFAMDLALHRSGLNPHSIYNTLAKRHEIH